MASGYSKQFLKKVIDAAGEVIYAKRYDYKLALNKSKTMYAIVRREMEGEPWEILYTFNVEDTNDMSKWKRNRKAFANDRLFGKVKF